MKKLLLSWLILGSLNTPVLSQEYTASWHSATPIPVVATVEAPHKPPFSIRHPVVYRRFLATRKACSLVLPILQAAAAVLNILAWL